MGEFGDFVPFDGVASTVGAEDRVGGVVHIGFGIVGGGCDDLFGVMAWLVAAEGGGEMAMAVRVLVHIHRIVAHFGHRRLAFDHGVFAIGDRGFEGAGHALDVAHGTADHVCGHFEPEPVPRFQQSAVALPCGVRPALDRRLGPATDSCPGFHEPLANRPVRGLTEVAAFGVLQMRAAGHQSHLDIGERRANEHTEMLTLGQVGQNQPLPIAVQIIFGQGRAHSDSAARLPWFQQDMRFGIMTERLEMTCAFDRRSDGLTVQDGAGAKGHIQTEPVVQGLLDDFQLDCAHQLHMNLGQPFHPHHMQQRVFVFQLTQCGDDLMQGQIIELGKGRRAIVRLCVLAGSVVLLIAAGSRLGGIMLGIVPIHAVMAGATAFGRSRGAGRIGFSSGGQHRVGQHGLQRRRFGVRFRSQPFAGEGPRQSGHRAYRAGRHFGDRLEFGAIVDAHLIDFLGPRHAIILLRWRRCRRRGARG